MMSFMVWLDGHVVGSYSEQHKAQAQARLLGGHVEAVYAFCRVARHA